ncbi:MAG: discoidin domain-containing protein [Bacteroidaceae bacterium]|nr:discoidin domain-containing protein [Bacteroidaceae bacterium]
MRGILLIVAFTAILPIHGQFSRGIGIYPGNPAEYFGPTFETDMSPQNLALHRAVYQSASHDKNLTAQLLTDGERSTSTPAYLVVRKNGKPLPTADREKTINESEWSSIVVEGSEATLSYEWTGMAVDADEVVVEGYVAYDDLRPSKGFSMKCETTSQGRAHSTILKGDSLPGTPYRHKVSSDPNKQIEGEGKPARALKETFTIQGGKPIGKVEFTLSMKNALYWSVREVTFRKQGKPVHDILPAAHFHSVWLTDGPEWAYVDLGHTTEVTAVKLYPISPSGHCTIDISQDAQSWKTIGEMSCTRGASHTPVLHANCSARYVRISTDGPAAIAEMEVEGHGRLRPVPHPPVGWTDAGRFMLDGGPWTLCPVDGPDNAPCGPEIVATVPATILSSYHNAGALPDPNFDDQLSMISESFFNRNFLYRRTFSLPPQMKGKRVLLHFDGINWKAEVRLNGERLGRIDGAFLRREFDISDWLKEENTLEVFIHSNAHPGSRKTKTALNTSFNGGVLGADNPTFHATIGWDWITTTPGRDIGIWNDVYLTAAEAVTLSDPYVATTLKEGLATMTPHVFLKNHTRESVAGLLEGYIGDIRFEKTVLLEPEKETEVTFSPRQYSQLRAQEMDLWWPTGYGTPTMYQAGYTFTPTNTTHNEKAQLTYLTGIREVTYKSEMQQLQLYINSKRFIPLGGNWGFSESHLNYRGREYDAAVRYHSQMNCNMIRNWVGQTGDEEFYEACDRHGVMVWQDFWLANPVDGPNPDDERMFMQNATDFVRRIRQHPSLALFCGRNEGYPPATLNAALDQMTEQLMPGSLYIPSSADDGVSGHGPYQARPVKEYFERQTGKLHTERGMPNIPDAPSMRRMLSPEHLWPQGDAWGQHDFTQQGAQGGASFNHIIKERFGPLRVPQGMDSLSAYTALAQWQNYDGYRAMYEASNTERQGLLIWMSHPCWPSTVWQTYDYYLAPTAAYFGVKKACEPLHAQYNALTGMVQVVNLSRPTCEAVVTATIHDLQGNPLWQRTARVESLTDTTIDCFWVGAPAGHKGTYFLTLSLSTDEENPQPVGTKNTYVLSSEPSQEDLWKVPEAQVSVRQMEGEGKYLLTNTGKVPAIMLRLSLKGEDGEQILPVIYSENYFHLMPGESQPVDIQWNEADTRGTRPVLHVSGFNLPERQ